MNLFAVKLSLYHIASAKDMEHFYPLTAVALYQKMVRKDGVVTNPTALWAVIDGNKALEVNEVYKDRTSNRRI